MKRSWRVVARGAGCAGLLVLAVMWCVGRWGALLMGSGQEWIEWIGFAGWVLVSWWVVAVAGCGAFGLLLIAARMRRLGAVVVGVAVVMLVASTRPWRWANGAPAVEGATLRVLTLNTLFSNRDFDAIERLIRRERPDVVFFQEFHAEQHAALSARLADVYGWREAVTRENNRGLGIYSVVALRDVGMVDVPGPIWDAPPLVVTAETALGDVRLVCVHLAAPQGPGHAIENLRCARRLGEVARERSMPMVIAGDHNMGEWSASHAAMEDAGLSDAFATAGRGAGMSIGLYGLPWWLWMRVDYVWSTPELRAVRARVVEGAGSDHRSVVVELGR